MTEAPEDGSLVLDRSWWSFAGPHGGYVASHLLRATSRLTAHSARSLHVQFTAAGTEGPAELQAVLVREGRTATFASATLSSDGRILARAASVHGGERPGPAVDGPPMPPVDPPEHLAELRFPQEFVPFAQHLEYRPASKMDFGAGPAQLVSWVRFRDDRPVDALAATVLADALPPALYGAMATPLPVPTADLYVQFCALRPVAKWALVRITTTSAGDGWCVDDSEVWSRDGLLLASARQTRLVLAATA